MNHSPPFASSPMPQAFAVLGDIHGRWPLAYQALERLEAESQQTIVQVFCVGDLGLFLHESDWVYLTGPSKHRHPEWSAGIREAWNAWRWPTAAIGGNHEPWHKLRAFDREYFSGKLTYTNAGVLDHQLAGLRVVGLSGIRGGAFEGNVPWTDRLRAVAAGSAALPPLRSPSPAFPGDVTKWHAGPCPEPSRG